MDQQSKGSEKAVDAGAKHAESLERDDKRYRNPLIEHLFHWWRVPADRFAALIAAGTVALFGATIALWSATADLVHDAQESSRAWVVPRLMKLEAPLKAGEAANLGLYHGNTGREPALHVRHYREAGSFAVDLTMTKNADILTHYQEGIRKTITVDTCDKAGQETLEGIVYPSPIEANVHPYIIDAKEITPEVVSGQRNLVVKGCFVYMTVKKLRKSKYCFVYNAGYDQIRPQQQRSLFQVCPVDNDAS
jgi:hypothetical protein